MKGKKTSRYIQSAFYIFAGLNHFLNPDFYLPLIPDYLPYHHFINVFSGVVEVVFGIGILLPKTRRVAASGIILMLIAFIPSHIYFIWEGSCVGELCVNPFIGWGRLLIIHPLLVYWAYSVRR